MNMSISPVGGGEMPHAVSGASGNWNIPPQQKMSNLFNNIDSSGTGTINESQFDQAFKDLKPPAAFKNAGADAIWKALDPGNTGKISRQNFVSKMKELMVTVRQDDGTVAAQTASAGTRALNNLGRY